MNYISTCISGFTDPGSVHTIAYYTHTISIVLGLFLGVYCLIKTKYSRLSIAFFAFTFSFSLWLLGDLFTWTSPNYLTVYFFWSWLDYANIAFFALGTYFFSLFVKENVPTWEKCLIILIALPGLFYGLTNGLTHGFYQPWCVAIDDNFETTYKLYAEMAYCLMLLMSFIIGWVKAKGDSTKKIQITTIGLSVFLFFVAFGVTEYFASVLSTSSNLYELNLYTIFGLPLFLIAMTFTISNLGLFKLRFLGTQLLVYVLLVLIGSQLLFLKDSTAVSLTIATLVAAVGFGYLLIRNTKREMEARAIIETQKLKLEVVNTQLVELNKQKSEFVSFASHQLRSPLTSIKGNSSLILEGDAGPISPMVKQIVETILEATKTQINVVESYLNSSRIELGTMKYSLVDMDFKMLTEQVMNEQKPNIEAKGLTHTLTIDESQTYKIKADPDKFKQVLMNIVDNSLKYTTKGSVNVSLIKDAVKGVITFKVSDTGVGIRPDVMPKLFQKFSRADNANEANIHGTGLGLYIARDIVKAHNGRVWAESEGEGKGSQFYVEVPEAK